MFHRKSFNDGLKQTIFSNLHDGKVKLERLYYAIINIDGVNTVHEYEAKFRSAAIAHFNRVARRNNGRVDTISSFRN